MNASNVVSTEKIEVKVYVNEHDSVSDIQPSCSSDFLQFLFLYELLRNTFLAFIGNWVFACISYFHYRPKVGRELI